MAETGMGTASDWSGPYNFGVTSTTMTELSLLSFKVAANVGGQDGFKSQIIALKNRTMNMTQSMATRP